MPKKRQKPRKPASPQQRGGGGRTPPIEQLERLEPHLRTWLVADPSMEDRQDAEAVIVLLFSVIELAEKAVELTDLYAWTPDQVTRLLDLLDEAEEKETGQAGQDPDELPIPTAMFASSLAALLAFIEESGRWRGAAGDYPEVEEILADATGSDEADVLALREIADAELEPDAQAASAAAIDAMPLSRSLLGLLPWMAPSKPVVADALSPDALLEAAARLGVAPGDTDADHAGLVVGEALDALVGAGLVDVTADAVIPTSAARELVDDLGEYRSTLEVALTFFLEDVLSRTDREEGDDGDDEAPEPGELALAVLSTALIDGESMTEDVDRFAELGTVRPVLDELRGFGYLAAGEPVRVTPGLEQLTAEAVLMIIDSSDDEGDDLPVLQADGAEAAGDRSE